MPNNTTSPTFISSQDASELANVSLKTIRNWRNKNHFSWHQENNKGTKSKILIDKGSFQEYLQIIKEQTTDESNGTSHQVPLSPITSPIAPPITSPIENNEKSHQVPLETELLLIKQKVKHLEENLQKAQEELLKEREQNRLHHQDLKAELIKKDQAIEQRDEEVKELRRKLDQKEASHISHIGQIASLTSQVGILTNQVEALKQFQEAYNKRVNMGAIKRLFSAAEAIDIKVELNTNGNKMLTEGEIIETDKEE